MFPSSNGWLELAPLNKVCRLGRIAAPELSDWFDPYGVAVGVGSNRGLSLVPIAVLTVASVRVTFDAVEPPDAFASIAVGVGNRTSPCGRKVSDLSAPSEYIVSVPDAPREALGVGSNCTTADGSIRSPDEPR